MAAGGMTGADVWRVIRGHIWLIILFAVVSAAAGYGVNRALLKYMPEYTTQGLLEIDTRQFTNLVENQVADMADSRVLVELRTQAQRLQSEALFSAVLKKPDSKIRQTQWFAQFSEPSRFLGNQGSVATRAKKDLLDNFRVSPIPDSKLLSVRFSAPSSEDSRVVMVELVDEHLRQQREAATEAYNTQIQSLRAMSEQFKAELGALGRQIETQQASLTARGMPVGRAVISAREIELRTVIDSRLEAQKDESEARAAVQSADAQQQEGRFSRVEEVVENDPTMLGLQREVLGLVIQRDTVRDRMGAEHADVRRIERQIDVLKQQVDLRRDELRTKFKTQYMEGVKSRLAQTQAVVTSLMETEKRLRDEMGEMSKELADLLGKQAVEASLREEKTAVDSKIRDLVALSGLQGSSRIRWAAQPEVPEVPSFPQLKLVMPLAVFIGLALALGIAFLREFLNDTVRSPRDVTRVGQMTLLGLICDEADDPQAANARLAIFDAPHSMTAEQFRQIRTRLNQAASLETTRSIMITGPSPMDGKTTVAANLAAGLALNGRRILLVDANFRRPEMHRLFGLSNEGGFAEVLTGQSPLEQRVHATRIPNLSVLPSGPKPANVTELFESQLFTDFVEHALQSYDHVIFDSGPLLVVSESAAMAPRVDGVVTVVRAHAESRGLLQRMRDALRQLKAEHVGVILNAVRAQGGGYYGRNIKTYYDYQSEA